MTMYVAFCAAICLAVFCVVAALLTAVVMASSSILTRVLRRLPAQLRATSLFVVTIAPFAAGLFLALGVALPAFLLYEPPWYGEEIGLQLPLLALAGLLWIAFAAGRGLRLVRRTSGLEHMWHGAVPRDRGSKTRAKLTTVDSDLPLLGTVGFVRPRVYASGRIIAALSEDELKATLAHEAGHIRAADNFKRLLLAAIPGAGWMLALRSEWIRASEVAADEAAVESGVSALDLASALVKVGRMRLHCEQHPEVLASHFVPPGTEMQVADRVQHLTRLIDGKARPTTSTRRYLRSTFFIAAAAYATYFIPLTRAAHELLERVVR